MSEQELLAEIFDKCTNLLAASRLPLSDDIHVLGLKSGMEDIQEMCRPFWEKGTEG